MSLEHATCYDEGPTVTGQLYELRTDHDASEPPIVSRGSALSSHIEVAPSILLTEVEGPPSWP